MTFFTQQVSRKLIRKLFIAYKAYCLFTYTGWTGDSWVGGRRQSDGTVYSWYGINTGAVSISYWGDEEPNEGDGQFMHIPISSLLLG